MTVHLLASQILISQQADVNGEITHLHSVSCNANGYSAMKMVLFYNPGMYYNWTPIM